MGSSQQRHLGFQFGNDTAPLTTTKAYFLAQVFSVCTALHYHGEVIVKDTENEPGRKTASVAHWEVLYGVALLDTWNDSHDNESAEWFSIACPIRDSIFSS